MYQGHKALGFRIPIRNVPLSTRYIRASHETQRYKFDIGTRSRRTKGTGAKHQNTVFHTTIAPKGHITSCSFLSSTHGSFLTCSFHSTIISLHNFLSAEGLEKVCFRFFSSTFQLGTRKPCENNETSCELRHRTCSAERRRRLHKRVSCVLCMCSALQTSSITTYHCLPNSWPIRDSEICRTLLLLVLPPTPVHLSGTPFLCTCNLKAPITHHSCRITAKHLPHQPSPVTCPLPCVLTSLSKSMFNDFNHCPPIRPHHLSSPLGVPRTCNPVHACLDITSKHISEISHPQILPLSLPVSHTTLHTTHDFVQVFFRTLQVRYKSASTDHSQTLHHPSGRPGQRFPCLKTCPVLPNFDSDHRPLPICHALPTPALSPLHLCTLSTS